MNRIKIPFQRRHYHVPREHQSLTAPYHIIAPKVPDPMAHLVPVQKTILGLDTETIDGVAKLVCSSDGSVSDLKSFSDFIDYCHNNALDETVNMFYNLKYDAQAILSYLDIIELYDLHLFGTIQTKKYKVNYIPKKKLTINSDGKTFKFYDIFQFFRVSLNKASKRYFNTSKLEIDIKKMNDPKFWITDYDDIVKYCIVDAELCQKLGVLAKTQFNGLGLSFNNPISTASMSEQLVIRYGSLPTYSLPYVQEFGYYSYWGGRFEQLVKGYLEQVYKWDINSAYPYAMTRLPDISNGTWEFTNENISECTFGFLFVKMRTYLNYIEPVQLYNNGVLTYPKVNWHYRYITLEEYDLFLEYNLAEIEVIRYSLFYPNDSYKPFHYLNGLYTGRLLFKAKSDPRQLPLKIVMNSTYGKFIQMIIRSLDEGVYYAGQMFLPVYASYTTSSCRSQVLRLILEKGIKPLAIYTDCIITEDNLKYNSKRLGGWALQDKGELLSVGCGVYSIRDGDKETSHFRGFKADKDKSLFKLLEANLNKSSIPMPFIRPLGLGELVRHTRKHADSHLNEWLNYDKKLDLNFDKKRIWNKRISTSKDLLGGSIDSTPLVLKA